MSERGRSPGIRQSTNRFRRLHRLIRPPTPDLPGFDPRLIDDERRITADALQGHF
jgi:hypothetical protein